MRDVLRRGGRERGGAGSPRARGVCGTLHKGWGQSCADKQTPGTARRERGSVSSDMPQDKAEVLSAAQRGSPAPSAPRIRHHAGVLLL